MTVPTDSVSEDERAVEVRPTPPAEPEAKPEAPEPAPEAAPKEEPRPAPEQYENVNSQILETLGEINEYMRESGDMRAKPPEQMTKDDLEELLEDDDPRMKVMTRRLMELTNVANNLNSQLQAMSQKEAEQALAKDIADTRKAYPGMTKAEEKAVVDNWNRLIQDDDRYTIMAFEDIARRTFGAQWLEARRTSGPTPAPKPAPGPAPAKIVDGTALGGPPDRAFHPSKVDRLDQGEQGILEAHDAVLKALRGA